MQILLGILDSIRRGILWATGTFTSQIYIDATYAPLANGSYFAFGKSNGAGSTTAYQYSADGTTWSTGTLPASNRWTATATNGSRIVVFQNSATTGYYSDNGTTWTATNALDGANTLSPERAIWDGTRFIIPGANNTVRYSTDGITWTGASIGDTARRLGYDGISRHLVSNDSSSARTTTTFPTGWATTTYPLSRSYGCPIYGNGIWIIPVFFSTRYITSTNGTTWINRTLPSLFSEDPERDAKMMFTGGKFYYYYADNVYSSADGITWATDATFSASTLDNLNGWAVGPNTIIGVGVDNSTSGGVGTNIFLKGTR